MFENGIFKQKNGTLRYVKNLYAKRHTLRKNQENLRYVFIFKNPDTLRNAIFF